MGFITITITHRGKSPQAYSYGDFKPNTRRSEPKPDRIVYSKYTVEELLQRNIKKKKESKVKRALNKIKKILT